MATQTDYTANIGTVPWVAVDDQNRASAIGAWFFGTAANLLRGNDAAPTDQSRSVTAAPSIALGADQYGRLFVQGRSAEDTAAATQPAAAGLAITPGLLVLGLLAFLALKR